MRHLLLLVAVSIASPALAQTSQGDVAVTIYNNDLALIQDTRQLNLPAQRLRVPRRFGRFVIQQPRPVQDATEAIGHRQEEQANAGDQNHGPDRELQDRHELGEGGVIHGDESSAKFARHRCPFSPPRDAGFSEELQSSGKF